MSHFPLEDEVPLVSAGSGVPTSRASRQGDVVLRQAGPWTPAVHALLRHFEAVGFDGAPRLVGSGFADDGRETLTYVEGFSPAPRAWPEEAMAPLGALIRASHDAAATFKAPAGAVWQDPGSVAFPSERAIVAHGDLGPWNVLATDGIPHTLIDWEFAGLMDPVFSLAEAGWLNAQLMDDDIGELQDLPSPQLRARALALLLDGYGLSRADRIGFVDKMIAWAVLSARDEASRGGVSMETTATHAPDGYPILWGITWRTRSAAWMILHRALLERAIGV